MNELDTPELSEIEFIELILNHAPNLFCYMAEDADGECEMPDDLFHLSHTEFLLTDNCYTIGQQRFKLGLAIKANASKINEAYELID